ncbi:halocyanin domain-containing protein [Haloferacaceae archaeon DSL9]
MVESPRRRDALKVLGTAAVAGLAGCIGGGSGGDIEEDTYGDWFQNANGFDGTEDRTDADEVTVAVGSGGGRGYDPAAVRITPGTTVVWEWTGRGAQHNVAEIDGAFESEYYVDEGETFEHTFEEPGLYRYVCTPHQAQGMVGAVDVVED